ncbi:MAG: trigger factor [Micrococcales bacterium]|nr:trigger factor [Micrococcales bacterium]MCL2666865.1 trigger factor [Micrococcales bacterium]
MKSAIETLEPTKVRLTVEVTLDELKPSIDHAYKHIAGQIQVPGFRKGKVPPRIIDQRVGRAAVLEHAVNEALPGLYADAVRENGLHPLAPPEVDVTAVPGLPGDDETVADELRFSAEIMVRPAIELPDLSTWTIDVDGTEVTDGDVNTRLDALRERFGTLAAVDRPAATGDFVTLDLVAKIDDEQVDQVSGVSYQIGSGTMLEGMDEALADLSAGEATTFETTLAGGERAGEKAQVTLTATAVKERQLPEADDDFAEEASEFDTMDELRAHLREQAAAGKGGEQAAQARDRLLDRLLAEVDVPVPADLVEAEVAEHLSGEDRDDDDEHRAEVVAESTAALRRQILLDTLAESLKVKVSQDDMLEYMLTMSQGYGMDPTTFISTMSERGQLPVVAAEVARGKSVAVALRQVKVVGPDGQVVDLTKYVGTDADDAPEEKAATVAPIDVEPDSDSDEGAGAPPLAPSGNSASDISSIF